MKYLADFARERKEEPNTVSTYIRRNLKEFEGLTYMEGKKKVLTDEAVAILEKVYPMPEPVQVIQDYETMKALAEAQAEIIELQKQIVENSDVVSQAKTALALIGTKDDQIGRLELDLKDEKKLRAAANQKIEGQQTQIEEQKQEIQDLKNQLLMEKNRKLSWKERLFGIKESNHFPEQPKMDACNAAVTAETEET